MDEDPVVGVVGDGHGLPDAVADAGGRVASGDPADVFEADPAVVVAVGEAAVVDVARADPPCPILPVDAGRGLRSVASADLADLAPALVDGDWERERHPLLGIERNGDLVERALTDVTLVTAEAAHISEFSVRAGETDVAQVRADGVVVATPAGSAGYARRIDAPVAAAETGVLAVAPIAPFATDPDHWVVPDDDLRLSVEREEAVVTLVADGESVGEVEMDDAIRVRPTGAVEVAVTALSAPRFP